MADTPTAASARDALEKLRSMTSFGGSPPEIETLRAYIERAERAEAGWTAVADAFPPNDGHYLVTATSPGYYFGWPHLLAASFQRWRYDVEVNAFSITGSNEHWTVTHWRNAPDVALAALPKEGEG